jgi:hypothetical protein
MREEMKDIKIGDVYEVVKTISFHQSPLYRTLIQGQKLWVTDVCDYYPILEKDDNDYAIFGEVAMNLIHYGDIKKIEPLPHPHKHYQIQKRITELETELKKLKNDRLQ